MASIYGEYEETLNRIKEDLESRFLAYQDRCLGETGEKGANTRIKRRIGE